MAPDRLVHLGECDPAVDRRLSRAQEVQVRAVQDEDAARCERCHWPQTLHRSAGQRQGTETPTGEVLECLAMGLRGLLGQILLDAGIIGQETLDAALGRSARTEEIGRASCRERV